MSYYMVELMFDENCDRVKAKGPEGAFQIFGPIPGRCGASALENAIRQSIRDFPAGTEIASFEVYEASEEDIKEYRTVRRSIK